MFRQCRGEYGGDAANQGREGEVPLGWRRRCSGEYLSSVTQNSHGSKPTSGRILSESKSYPELRRKKRGQQAKGGDSLPLLHAQENPRWSTAAPSTERHGPVWAGLEEDHDNGRRTGMTVLWRKAERVRVVQPGEEHIPGKPYCALSIYKGGL